MDTPPAIGRALAKRAAVQGVLLRARTTSSSTNARRVKLPSSVPGAPPGTRPTPNRGMGQSPLRRLGEGGALELAILAEHRMPHALGVRDAPRGAGAEVVGGPEFVERLGVLVIREGERLGGLEGRLRGRFGFQPGDDGG